MKVSYKGDFLCYVMIYIHLLQLEKIDNDIKAFLLKYNKEFTYKHSIRVANEAKKIAEKFHVDKEKAAIAGYLA